MESVVFDDWLVRHESAFCSRKKEYRVVLVLLSFATVGYLVTMLFYWYVVVFAFLLVIAWLVCILEWMKIKNHHMIITENAILITDRFGREKQFPVQYHACTLAVRKSFNAKSGGIWLEFYDENKRLLCRYEDMLNHAAAYGQPLTQWERAIFALGIPVEDKSCNFKNQSDPFRPI